jgi:AraC-like DNA-binding protein
MVVLSSDAGTWPNADALSEVLQDLRLSEGSYGRCELSRPWGIDFPSESAARFHFVVEGRCWLHTSSSGWIPLEIGDVALLPHGISHALSDVAKAPNKTIDELPLEPIGDRVYRLREGGGGAKTLLTCCTVKFENPAVHPLIELMPPLLLVRAAGTTDPVLPLLLDAMADEVRGERMGSATVMTRLADVVITRVVRSWVEGRPKDTTGWLAAIRDPSIGRALAHIHRRPGDPWSVESLADAARTSRSIFSERFAAVVGMPPARYLARWRMHLATSWLQQNGRTVGEVATQLGYRSEASFSRAFKRFVGFPPSALRPAVRRRQPGDEGPGAGKGKSASG